MRLCSFGHGLHRNRLVCTTLGTCIVSFTLHTSFRTAVAQTPSSAYRRDTEDDFACKVPETFAQHTYAKLQERNCRRAEAANTDFLSLASSKDWLFGSEEEWYSKSARAEALCNQSAELLDAGDYYGAADLAVNAWGTVLMEGMECCIYLDPPYCLNTTWTTSTVMIVLMFAMPFALLVGTCIYSFQTARASKSARQSQDVVASQRSQQFGKQASNGPGVQPKDLQQLWETSSLRVLNHAAEFAASSSSVFAALGTCFDFQADNVCNQYEHFLSLWRSHVAIVADRMVETTDVSCCIDESTLLHDALVDLHAELMEGFDDWRAKFHSSMEHEEENGVSTLLMAGGITWQAISPAICVGTQSAEELSVHLMEIAAYLLVWGEAGNLRFMPEALYFITDLVLSAEPPGPGGVYDGLVRGRSSLFLAQVVRPIYAVIFKEVWQYVRVRPGTPADKQAEDQKIHDGYDAYLPCDVANYDDWNELFCDPERLENCIVLDDGSPLASVSHTKRFTALIKVDWPSSLDASKTKTHREMHSLWGVFATTHRIWFLHALLFFLCKFVVEESDPHRDHGQNQGVMPQLMGSTKWIRLATIGLLVSFFGAATTFAKFHVLGKPIRAKHAPLIYASYLLWLVPIATYVGLRLMESYTAERSRTALLIIHFAVTAAGLIYLLFFPAWRCDRLWELTPVPLRTKILRHIFWIIVLGAKFYCGMMVIGRVHTAAKRLDIAVPGRESWMDIADLSMSTVWTANVLEWFTMWLTTFIFFISDTQLWFTTGCAVLGTGIMLAQRACKAGQCALEDAMSKLPQRFSEKVLPYCYLEELRARRDGTWDGSSVGDGEDDSDAAKFPKQFIHLWDRIVEYMRYEDKVSYQGKGNLSFFMASTADVEKGQERKRRWHPVSWEQLRRPVDSQETAAPEETWNIPEIFRESPVCERAAKHYCGAPDMDWPNNPDLQWRLLALSRGMALPMPRPYRAPYIPGLTVLVPHYGEDILLQRQTLYRAPREDDADWDVPLIDWLVNRYKDEFINFTSRHQNSSDSWPNAGTDWEDYTQEQWEKVIGWSSMRMQTLWRTLAGLWLYNPALQALFELQGDRGSRLSAKGVWDASECFTLMPSMQRYKYFSAQELRNTNLLFRKFGDLNPKGFQLAFCDHEDKGALHDVDGVHEDQARRYYACLVDGTCPENPDGTRQPRLRIELPGYFKLGDGKGDNQNYAIIFTRGAYIQCIDANQGAYFEQMLLLPNVLGEFRTQRPGDGRGKRIIGLPEHITSDIGSVGDMAACAEIAFGTLLQRTYAVLGARMHYGHPDIMNKQFMIQQGGVSKATKTVNLSEDIFAGMDFTLRGQGRQIRHCEYMHLAKGRDLGFNTVLGFYSKISSGAGEQVITRQMFRLGNMLGLPEMLTFWYAHVGYYMTQFLVSIGMPMLVFFWMLVLCSDCDEELTSFSACAMEEHAMKRAVIVAEVLTGLFSSLVLFFVFATLCPLFAQLWYERSFLIACMRIFKQLVTLSPLLFIFQAKVIGFYVMNELRYGGATYVATGRGLPTERRPFISLRPNSKGSFEGLYLDYAEISYYDGATLLFGTILIRIVGGVSDAAEFSGRLVYLWISLYLTIGSWLFAPFIFNPYHFDRHQFVNDVKGWYTFVFTDSGEHWAAWWQKTQLKKGGTNRNFIHFLIDIGLVIGFFIFAAWFTAMNQRLEVLDNIFSESKFIWWLHVHSLLPPVFLSLLYSAAVAAIDHISPGQDVPSSSESDVEVSRKVPLAFSAVVVFVLTTVELVLSVCPLLYLDWHKSFIAAMIVKLMLLRICITVGENMLRSRYFGGKTKPEPTTWCGRVCSQWVHACRFFRDIFTSFLILVCLTPIALLSAVNDALCPGCSWHQLLIYRDTGHRRRQQAVLMHSRQESVRSVRDVSVAKVRNVVRHTPLIGGSSQPSTPSYKQVRQVPAYTRY